MHSQVGSLGLIFVLLLGLFSPARAQVPTDESYRAIQLGDDLLQRGKVYLQKSQDDSALICFEGALLEFDKAQYREGAYVAGILLGELLEKEHRIETFIDHKQFFQPYPDQSDSLGVALNLAMAKAFMEKGELLKAHAKLAYCKNTLEGKAFATPEFKYQILQGLINLYEKLEFHREVIRLYERHRDFFREESSFFLSIPALIQLRLSFAQAYVKCAKFEKAATLLLQVEYLLQDKSTQIPQDQQKIIQEKLGKLQLSVKNYPAATRSFDTFGKLSASQAILLPSAHYHKGRLAYEKGEGELAEEWLQKAAQGFLDQNQIDAPAFRHTQLLLAQHYLKSARAEDAIRILKKLLGQTQEFGEEIGPIDPQILVGLAPSRENYQILSLFAQSTLALSQEQENPSQDLKKESIIAYQQAMQMGDSLRGAFAFLDFSLNSEKDRRAFYEGGIALALELMEESKDERYLGIAFQFQQRKKAEDAREIFTQYFREHGVPWDFDHELNRKYLIYKIRQQEERAELLEGEDKILLEELIKQDKEELAIFLKALKSKYRAFMEISNSSDITDIGSLRDELKPFECMISFFEGEKHLYSFELRESGTSYRIFKRNDELLGSFLRSIEEKDEDILSFQIKAHELYQALVEPYGQDSINSLIIIPDGILHYLPFEVLLESQNHRISEYGQLPYLIHKYPIRYLLHSKELLPSPDADYYQQAYKIAMFFPDLPPPHSTNTRLASPEGQQLSSYPSIPKLHNLKEKLKKRAQLINASFVEKESATASNFDGYGNLFKCIELDGYALSSDVQAAQSHLILHSKNQSDSLGLSQIFQGNFPADLILLPYHYRIGPAHNGSGMKAMLTSFQYAKTQNMLISLWGNAAPEHQLPLSEFYRQLFTGRGKAYSLQKAKIQHLKQPSSYHHPHYWASLVLYGDNTELSGEERPWWTYAALFFALFMLFLIIFGFWRKRRKA